MKFIATIIVLAAVAYWFVYMRGDEAPPPPLTYSASFSALSDAEKAYYEKMFDYSMDMMRPGQGYDWQTYGGKGKITAGEPFVSKSNVHCRPFDEVFYAGETPYRYEGIACKRQGREGWCRLKKTDALTCALERMESPVTKGARQVILKGGEVVDSIAGTNIGGGADVPSGSVSAPGGPSLNAPDVKSPKLEPKDFRPPMPWEN